MTVSLGEFGEFKIYHKTKMGNVHDVLAIGNLLREQKGLSPYKLDDLLKREGFWEFVCARQKQLSKYSESSELEILEIAIDFDKVKGNDGKVKYGDLIPLFPNLIQSKRGRYGGTYMERYLLYKIAMYLDKDLEVEMIRVIDEDRLLELRDAGGDSFKEMATLFKNTFNLTNDEYYHYINLSNAIRNRIGCKHPNGYNDEDTEILKEREAIHKNIIAVLKSGLVKTPEDLYTAIKNL